MKFLTLPLSRPLPQHSSYLKFWPREDQFRIKTKLVLVIHCFFTFLVNTQLIISMLEKYPLPWVRPLEVYFDGYSGWTYNEEHMMHIVRGHPNRTLPLLRSNFHLLRQPSILLDQTFLLDYVIVPSTLHSEPSKWMPDFHHFLTPIQLWRAVSFFSATGDKPIGKRFYIPHIVYGNHRS